jgi:hypothetical protein
VTEEVRRPWPLLTDEPGVLLHQPRRKLIRVLVVYALLPLICAAAGAYISYELAAAQANDRISALESDLAQRRANRASMDAAQASAAAQFRTDMCVLADRTVPRDQAVEEIRRRYGCIGTPPPVSPSSTRPPPSPSRRAAGNGGAAKDPARPAPAPRPSAGRPGPPGPSGPPGPPGPQPTPVPPADGLICVPVLQVCVL